MCIYTSIILIFSTLFSTRFSFLLILNYGDLLNTETYNIKRKGKVRSGGEEIVGIRDSRSRFALSLLEADSI